MFRFNTSTPPTCEVTVDTITGFSSPQFIAHDNDTERMYVSDLFTNVSVIDTTTNTVINTITVGNNPAGIAYDPINRDIYVTNFNAFPNGTVSVIDTTTNTVIDTITVGDGPYAIALDPINQRMYVANLESDDVSVIDTTPSPPSL